MCPICSQNSHVIKKGFYRRFTGKSLRIQRLYCKACKKCFSEQTGTLTYRLRKPHLNQSIFRLLVGGNSQRETAYYADCTPRTVARRVGIMGRATRRLNAENLSKSKPANEVIFDEMETFEHSKMKPLSIGVVVTKERRIVGASVAQMPAKGLLAARSRRKYGYRKDHRPEMLKKVLMTAKTICHTETTLRSDKNPSYAGVVRATLPDLFYEQFKGIRGCVVGQGELKATARDPLFSLNHTCAMFRDRLKRLSRRTWCTTKDPKRLQDLLDMYSFSHNQRLDMPKQRVRLPNVRCS